MVWHAYMLNPRAYLEDCIRSGRLTLWHTPLPWQAIADSIHAVYFTFDAGDEAQRAFEHTTTLPWANLAMPNTTRIKCPACNRSIDAPLTTCTEKADMGGVSTYSGLSDRLDRILASGTGYCDQNFTIDCPSCAPQQKIDHKRLRAAKFCNDVKLLVNHTVPMAGTILSRDGLPGRFGGQEDKLWKFIHYTPNSLILKDDGMKTSFRNIETVCGQLESKLNDRKFLREASKSGTNRMMPVERMAVRCMMSRYWENSSPFALDLVGAVIRQGNFVEKMHHIDWLHSPALPSTMRRLIDKYGRFVIMRLLKGQAWSCPSEMSITGVVVQDLRYHIFGLIS
jgi:hypothetical protein